MIIEVSYIPASVLGTAAAVKGDPGFCGHKMRWTSAREVRGSFLEEVLFELLFEE